MLCLVLWQNDVRMMSLWRQYELLVAMTIEPYSRPVAKAYSVILKTVSIRRRDYILSFFFRKKSLPLPAFKGHLFYFTLAKWTHLKISR